MTLDKSPLRRAGREEKGSRDWDLGYCDIGGYEEKPVNKSKEAPRARREENQEIAASWSRGRRVYPEGETPTVAESLRGQTSSLPGFSPGAWHFACLHLCPLLITLPRSQLPCPCWASSLGPVRIRRAQHLLDRRLSNKQKVDEGLQGLRIHLPIQGMLIWSLVREDSTCPGSTKPVHHSYWAP